MKIYKNEKQFAQKFENNTVAYCAPIITDQSILIEKKIAFANELAEKQGKISDDLYPIISLLVSSVWNKNDDVFTAEEIYTARHTPKHHPTNIDHEQTNIIGNIIDVWPVDENHELLADDLTIDELPEKMHLINSSVIYTKWTDPTVLAQVQELITEIEAGKRYVSMEAVFSDFDYAIADGEEVKIVARNEQTSFLTKHLRAFGGEGQFEGKKVGRLLKNITFIGKGYVERPANEESIIFNISDDLPFVSTAKDIINSVNKQNGVLLTVSENKFSGKTEMDNEKMVQALEDKIAKLEDKLAKSNVEKFEAQIKDLETKLDKSAKASADLNSKISDLEVNKVELEAKVSDLTQAKEALETEKEALSTKAGELEQKIADQEKKAILAARVSDLVASDVEKADAEALVEKFSDLEDAQWDAIAQMKKDQMKSKKDEKEDDKDKSKASQDDIDLDSEDEPNPALGGEGEDEDEQVFVDLQKSIASLLNVDIEK